MKFQGLKPMNSLARTSGLKPRPPKYQNYLDDF